VDWCRTTWLSNPPLDAPALCHKNLPFATNEVADVNPSVVTAFDNEGIDGYTLQLLQSVLFDDCSSLQAKLHYRWYHRIHIQRKRTAQKQLARATNCCVETGPCFIVRLYSLEGTVSVRGEEDWMQGRGNGSACDLFFYLSRVPIHEADRGA
jgi:hypothetical protein